MEHKQLELFQEAITACNVGCCVVFKDNSNLSRTDNGLRLRLYEDYNYQALQFFLEQYVTSGKMIRYQDSFGMFYLFLHLPSLYLYDYESPHFVIGPYLETTPKPETIRQIMEHLSIPEQLFEDIRLYYASTPVLSNIESFESLVLNLSQGLFHTEYSISHLPDQGEIQMEHSPLILKIRKNPEISVSTIEERYKVENQMLEAVSKGDEKRAHELHQKFQTFQLRPRTENALLNKKHGVIILNTLFRKAIEAGGVHPLYIDDLSGKFAILINEARSERELDHLASDMLHKYCLMVKNHSMTGYSRVIKDVISYIDFHYAEDLSLAFFAEMCNMNKNYLSSLFKKEAGITLTDYIHQVRLRRAITLINSSSLSITTIAASCGYNDINYFTRIFKRTYGMSPKQYQKSILRPS